MNGRQKGSKSEREVAGLFRAWWEPFEPGVLFARTPLSGGWGTAQGREAWRVSGDIMTTSTIWPWSVEVKRREAWSWQRVYDMAESPVWGWWRQCCRAAAEERRSPMLWFRKSREPWRVMVPEAVGRLLHALPGFEDAPVIIGYTDRRVKAQGIIAPSLFYGTDILRASPEACAAATRVAAEG